MQVDESVQTYGRTVPLRSTVVYGGIPMDPQIKALRGGIEILVATPGRLLDLVGQRVANLGQVEILVLDEADRMLDMGFLPDIQRIIALLPAKRQNLMFSATFSDDIRRLSGGILRDPATVEVAPRNTAARGRSASWSTRSIATARRRCWPTSSARTTCARCSSSPGPSWPPRRLANRLDREGLDAVAIHSDRSQPERTRALEGFKSGEIRVLVATDVAARGLDIEDLPVVVNFELPWNPQDYIHRIGRTGRAGATGEAISLVCIDETDLLRGVQRMLKHAIPWTVEEGFIPDRDAEPRPLGARAGHARTEPGAPRASQAGAPAGGRRERAAAGRPRRRRGLGEPAGGADRIDRGAREEEPEHQVGPDPLDRVAIDQRVVADRDAGLGPRADRQPDVAQHQELARRPGQRAAGVEAGQRRQLALERVRPRLEVDVVPRRVDRDARVVVGDRDRMSSLGIVSDPAAWAAGVVEALPGGAVERQRAVRPRGRRAALRGARGCRLPSPRSCRHRHGSPCSSLLGVAECPRRERADANDPSVPPRPAAGTGRRESGSRGAPRDGSGDSRRRTAVGLRQEGELEQVGQRSTFGSVRLWLVRTAIAIRSPGSQRTTARARGSGPEWPSVGWPSTSTTWTPRP